MHSTFQMHLTTSCKHTPPEVYKTVACIWDFFQTCPVFDDYIQIDFSHAETKLQSNSISRTKRTCTKLNQRTKHISLQDWIGSRSLVSQFTGREIFVEPKIEIIP